MTAALDVDARLVRPADRMYAAASDIGAVLKAYMAEFERTGDGWSAPGIMLRCLLASEPLAELRHAAAAYAKARNLYERKGGE